MNAFLTQVSTRFKALPAVCKVLILIGLGLLIGNSALDFGHGLGRGLYDATH